MSTINTPEHRQSLLGTDKMIIPISDADNNNTDEKQHADVIMSANIVQVTKKQSEAGNEEIKTQIDVVALTIEDNKESVTDTFKRLRAHFYTGATRSLQWRRSQLQSLRRMISENVAALENALLQDLKKNAQDSHLTEIGFVLDEIDDALRNVSKWMKPRSVGTNVLNMPGSSEIRKDPLGVVLIIAPWNYPVQLCLAPLVGAIAAGNCAVIKPSDIATATDAVLSSLIPRYMDKKAIATFSGGPAITTELMTCHWDLVFFTGSGMVAKIIAAAAAKNLIPCVLELGGKSPCIVDSSASLDVAVRRIVWGKFLNAGQTCVAPDYILVHESVHDTFVTKMKSAITDFYTSNPADSSDYCNIINANHHGRLSRLLTVVPGEEQKSDWTVECGGLTKIVEGNQRYFPPTVLTNVKPHHRVMEDEIFGPILPVIKYSALPDAIAFINSQPKPLALYIFSENSHNIDRVLSNTSAGGVTINDTLMHVINPNLPFGGVGPSGMGSYHGIKSFTTFTHEKSVLYKSGMNLLDVKARYPPSAPGKTRLMNIVLSTQSAVNAHGRLMLFLFLFIIAGLIALFVTKYAVKLW